MADVTITGDIINTAVSGATVTATTIFGRVVSGGAGPKGDQGDKGDTGAKGDTGDTGPAGVNGADGADGVTVSTALSDTADLTYNADTDVSGNGWVVDEDDMLSDLATKVPTQQSV